MIVISTVNFDENAFGVIDWLAQEEVVRINNDSLASEYEGRICQISHTIS
jgi:hypothetical protein